MEIISINEISMYAPFVTSLKNRGVCTVHAVHTLQCILPISFLSINTYIPFRLWDHYGA